MSTEIVCTIVTTTGMLISAVISWFISRQTANKEIEKLHLTWNREDVISSDEEFAEMVKAVAKYDNHRTELYRIEAIALVGSVRSKEYGELGCNLDALYDPISNNHICRLSEALSKVINQKRKNKGYNFNADDQYPIKD